MDLFDQNLENELNNGAPLADRMRPINLDEYTGQTEIVGEGSLLRSAIEKDDLPSMIFWGPPGSGKTTLSRVIAKMTDSFFVELSAVTAGVKDLREVIRNAQEQRKYYAKRTILFIDEIHRWSKSQQDGLLPYTEKGIITLIGATTENPSFEIIAPLLSRLRVYILKPLSSENLSLIIDRALCNKDRGLGRYTIKLVDEAREFLINMSGGDARIILNALEIGVKNAKKDSKGVRVVGKKLIEEALQHRALKYDKGGEEHYNIISAFIKSLRGSNVDGAIYWLARMIEAGEDPKFIARRMVVLASEDIGNADPRALVVANAVFSAVERIGMPEARINLAQGVVYLAKAKKSNSSYIALENALKDVKETMNLSVPMHLRNASTKFMKHLGYGKGYKYSHNEDDSSQTYLPDELKNKKYYEE